MAARTPTKNAVDMDQSPTTMAAAAMAAAVANRDRQLKQNSNDVVIENKENDSVVISSSDPTKLFNEEEPPTINSIEQIWDGGNAESNLSQTLSLLLSEIDSMVQSGLGAFHELDVANRQLIQSKELVETKSREATRMNAVEDQSRNSLSVRDCFTKAMTFNYCTLISNLLTFRHCSSYYTKKLLRAVESSKSEARSSSRSAQVESRLRATINTLRDERDNFQTEVSTYRRKLSLAEEELRLTKSKLTRVVQEKHSMERDSRAAISLARSLDNNNSNDMNYYKRKVRS